ncbi:MAG: hypothetical protein KBD01_01850 [Acidobacteria bacterium]|nr:hypothetical protein [Acidobacteriota bacterium]
MSSLRAPAVVLLSLGCAGLVLADPEPPRAFLVYDGVSQAEIRSLVTAASGTVIASLPDAGAALVLVDDAGLALLREDPRLIASSRGPLTDESIPGLDENKRLVAAAWNRMASSKLAGSELAEPGAPLVNDVMLAPAWWELLAPKSLTSATLSGRPSGAAWQNTSEYLAGHVSLNVVLLESNGAIDANVENWTQDMEALLISETLQATDSVVTLYPGSGLSFTVHFISGRTDARARTSYEPIARNADPSGATGEELWTTEVLAKLGYADGSRLTRSRLLADDTRTIDDSDWALNVFVANSFADTDGKFKDGYFGYAWLGGPHIILTYDNDGWGINRFDSVLRHEMHHSFFALDEYSSSGCTCTSTAGYLAGLNSNCENGCVTAVCVMRNNVASSCTATRTQVGTVDEDADGTADILQVPPDVTLALEGVEDPCDGLATFRGTAQVIAYPNANPQLITPRNNITLLEIAGVEVQVDEGDWQAGMASADDGAFDAVGEDYHVALSLPSGRHMVKVRSVDVRGNRSTSSTLTVDMNEGAAGITDSLRGARVAGGAQLSWDPAAGAATYRVRLATQPGAVFAADPVIETAATSWVDRSAGTIFYSVTAVDGCGRETP